LQQNLLRIERNVLAEEGAAHHPVEKLVKEKEEEREHKANKRIIDVEALAY
jgi:hypothetical protein